MTREQVIEMMADTIQGKRYNGSMWSSDDIAANLLSVLEASGLTIVPVEATDRQENALLETGLVEEGTYGMSAAACARTVYHAAIKAGKI